MYIKRFSVLLLILCVILLLLDTQAFAEWGRTADDYIRVPLGPQPKICSDGNRGAWVAANPIGLCHIDRGGNLTWGNEPFNIPPAMSYNPHPLLAENGDVILAMDYSEGYDDPPNVHVQRFDLDQEYVWGEAGIALDTSDRMQSVIGAYLGPIEGTYLVHWIIYDEFFNSIDWRLQLIDDNGDLLWGDGGMRVNLLYPSSKIVISSDRCVIGAHPLPVDDEENLEVLKISSNGDQLWDYRFTTRLEDLRTIKLRYAESDKNGGVILVYEYSRLEWLEDGHRYHYGIKTMRVSSDGDSLWTRQVYEREEEFQGETPGQLFPILNYAGSGRFFVAWADYPHAFQVVALNVDGELIWEEPVDVTTNQSSYGKLDAVDSDSGVCYVWRDVDNDREHGSSNQQWGQRISLNGERLWGDRGRAIQARPVEFSSITTDGNGGVITVVDFAIRTIQMINKNGEIGVVLEVGVDDEFDKPKPSRLSPQLFIYPNPGNSHFRIEFDSGFPDEMFRYSIFNLMGRAVATGTMLGAPYMVKDLSRFSSGEYILQLQSQRTTVSTRFFLVK